MKSLHAFVVSVVIALGACSYVYVRSTEIKVVYVNMEEVFQSFDGTQEYRSELEQMQKKHKQVLDSLGLEVMALENGRGTSDSLVIRKKRYYQGIYQEFKKNESEKTNESDLKIWKQINQYMKEYGTQKAYDFIQGRSGNGNLMYAKDELDKSKDFIDFMNKKYEGE